MNFLKMRIGAILLPLGAGIGLVAVILFGVSNAKAFIPISSEVAAAGFPEEANLNPLGSAYEINVGPNGDLWISDFGANEIWQVNPATGVYTSYLDIQAPSDARVDGAGNLWWGDGLGDGFNGRFGRLNLASGQLDQWELPGIPSLYGSQIDTNGEFWVSAWGEPYLFNFDPAIGQLCSYTLPLGGTASYPLIDGESLWLGDDTNGLIVKLEPGTNQVTTWTLPLSNSAPLGMALDDVGDLWFTDPNNGTLNRLRSDETHLDIFDPPAGFLLTMVSNQESRLWYAEQLDGTIGRLQPEIAASDVYTLSGETGQITPTCANIAPIVADTTNISTGSMTWITQSYPLLADSDGWRIYDLPTGAFPWGVVAAEEYVYFVDTDRLVLGRIPIPKTADISGCKVEDGDGQSGTVDDRTPIAGWPLTLTIDGIPQDPAALTGPDGCATWPNLPVTATYGLQEVLPKGWGNLNETSYIFPDLAADNSYSHTFVNVRPAIITACKSEDDDGKVATGADRTAEEGWHIALYQDGLQYGPAKETGAAGCVSWPELETASTYSLTEEERVGWVPLTPISHSVGSIQPGQNYSHTFVNSQLSSVTACKVEDADGNLDTVNDQSPVAGWEMQLIADGQPLGTSQLTGQAGCTSWSDLDLGISYGISETARPSWIPLTSLTHTFPPATSGSYYSRTFANSQDVTVIGCKVEDADGDLNTTQDQTPVAGVAITLTVDQVPQGPAQLTNGDGCTQWSGLSPGPSYGLQEQLEDGWRNLTPVEVSFGPATSGGFYTNTFVNYRSASVTACKVEDADGNPATTDDRTAVEGWGMVLTTDGVVEGATQKTGADGCTTWNDLDLGVTYGVSETMRSGWNPLGPASYTFAQATSGGWYSHIFVNTQQEPKTWLFLPLVVR